jgi:hypothetical protein
LTAQPFTATWNTITLSGTVKMMNGSAAGGVPLILSGTSTATTNSDLNYGTYSFTVQAGGVYTITASQSNAQFTPPSRNVPATASNVNGLDFTEISQAINFAAPAKEYIFMNGQVVAVENPH